MAKADKQRGDRSMSAEVLYWKEEIDTYERLFDKFLRRGRKVQKKYKDIRSPREEAMTRYNILWANTQTRLPALYARNPKVVVERRFRDADPVGRVSSEILERAIQYTLDHCNDAWQVNRQVVLDYELSGRGTVWIRYVPHFKSVELPAAKLEASAMGGEQSPSTPLAAGTGSQETAQPLGDMQDQPGATHGSGVEIAAMGAQTTNDADDEVNTEEIVHYEEAKMDYVYWEDFGHSWARVDDECRGKWRRVYMDREELEERFLKSKNNPNGLTQEQINSIPLDWSPKTANEGKIPMTRKKAVVYEIWDKRRRKVLWLVKNFPELLDKRDDMLGLKDFFPCPRSLLANLTNDELVPTPNFSFYQDQANEIDELSSRIVSITKALKVAGVRDTSAEGLDRLLSEGVENQLVPVEGWAVLKEKGGLKGVFELLPMQEIAETLSSLREQRSALIEDVYQLTGISDIVRGMSDPNETATAQQLKGQFSMIRIEDDQMEVQRFCRDEVVILGQIIAGYSIETLKAISGVKLLTNQEKQQIQLELAAQARMAQMQAQQPPPNAPAIGLPGAPQAAAAPPGMAHPAPPGQPPAAPPAAAPAPGAPPQAPAQAGGGMHPMAPGMPQTPGVGQAPVSPEKIKMLELPTWEEVEALLKNPVLREFSLDIETDSTIKMDEEAEKQARIELITSVGGFIQQALGAGATAPEILPMMGELLMFGIRAFKTARAVEQTFEDMMQALNKAAKQPKGPDPEIQKVQIQAQSQEAIAKLKATLDQQTAQAQQAAQAQQDAQAQQLEAARDKQKMQLDAQLAQHTASIDAQTETHKAQIQTHAQQVIEDLKNHFEAQRVQWETAAQERIAKLNAATTIETTRMKVEADERKQKAEHKHEKSMPKPAPKAA